MGLAHANVAVAQQFHMVRKSINATTVISPNNLKLSVDADFATVCCMLHTQGTGMDAYRDDQITSLIHRVCHDNIINHQCILKSQHSDSAYPQLIHVIS